MYPSKIILFGEYLVLKGSDLLGTPLTRYYGSWSKGQQIDTRLNLLADYIDDNELKFVNNQRFKLDILAGLKFESNIPQGYGCGSSGALIAALYDKYVDKKDNLKEQQRLSKLESFYHGSSSGVDPTLSLYKKTILFQKSEKTIIDNLALNNFYLYDSGLKRDADHFVATFLKKMQLEQYANRIEQIKHLSNKTISSLVNRSNDFVMNFISISNMQLELFDFAIPESVKKVWVASAEVGVFFKICGAGGGGYFLAYSANNITSDKFIPLF